MTQFTQRVVRLHTALDLPGTLPQWMMARDTSPWDPRTVAIMTFGSAKVRGPGLQGDGRTWLEVRPSSPYAYQHSVFGDFKAIGRYLRHHILKGARRWIARFVRADDSRAVQALVKSGGEDARRAWALLIWWQTCIRDLKLENWLTFRPFRWVSVPGVPELAGQSTRRKTFLPHADTAQEWMTRWISAIALLDFWCHTAQAAALDSAPRLATIGKRILGTRALPDWSLGINQDNRLVLCVDHPNKPCWRAAARQTKSDRQAASKAGAAHRLEQLRSACATPCLWFHGDTTEWTSGAGPMPDGLRDCKRHRLLAATPKRWFAIFPWTQAPCAGRAFVARCLSMPLAATGPSPSQAVRNLKYAVRRYENLQQADAAVSH